jgi:DNA repair photolyase
MIISASRRTDIPAFYSEWFINRIREGFLLVRNPFNAHQVKRVDLSPANVDTIVFWTRNPRPLLKHLGELDARGYRYYFQFTITGYPKVLEPFVPPTAEQVSTFKELSRRIGPNRVVWRFDPIILSDITPEGIVVETFSHLARELSGSTSRVVISFVHLYRSVRRNLAALGRTQNVAFHDESRTDDQARRIAKALAEIAGTHSMEIVSCAEKMDLSSVGITHGACIDAILIGEILGQAVTHRKDRYQRENCRCAESQDIGQYGTCTHGCIYCYASSNAPLARRNRSLHDPESPFLVAPVDSPDQKNGLPIP